jgi:hypothetical protein
MREKSYTNTIAGRKDKVADKGSILHRRQARMKDVSLPTDQRGGKMTKSATAVPGFREGQVSTVKMLGSM